jgi:hypothetical protein
MAVLFKVRSSAQFIKQFALHDCFGLPFIFQVFENTAGKPRNDE